MSRPAAPESDTPETDAMPVEWTVRRNGVPTEYVSKERARSLERRLSLAEAQIQQARYFIVEQSAGNIGGGEKPIEFLLASYKLMARERSLAQTEIKGHMRVVDELKVELMAEVDTISALVRERKEARARIAELEKAIVGECDDCGHTIITPLHPLPSVEQDAARYRWLRANHLQTGTDSWIRTGDDLEEAIDAALKSSA